MATINTALDSLDPSLRQSSTPVSTQQTLGKDAFLKMFMAQLKNQDPMSPMEGAEFATQMATFSQVEQLISINEKIGAQSANQGLDSLASYLGHQVRMGADAVEVSSGSAGEVDIDLKDGVTSLTIQLLDAQGNVKGEKQFSNLEKGSHTLELDDLSVQSGTFKLSAMAVGRNGAEVKPTVYSSGRVDGFIPGANPTLLVNGKNISPSSVLQVRA